MVDSKASRNRLICAGRAVPEGWVLIGRCHNPACGGEGANALIIKIPGRRELVCSDSPIPRSHRRIRVTRSEACPGDGDNAILIERIDP